MGAASIGPSFLTLPDPAIAAVTLFYAGGDRRWCFLASIALFVLDVTLGFYIAGTVFVKNRV